MGEYMTMDDSNFIGMQRGVRKQRRKKPRIMMIFAIFALNCLQPAVEKHKGAQPPYIPPQVAAGHLLACLYVPR